MRHLKNIIFSVLVGVILAALANQFTTSKYPPCDLVVKGIGVSTYGCVNSGESTYKCESDLPNSSSMTSCIQQNYYKSKTFPFGFKQLFGANSNLEDDKPRLENEISTFIAVFVLTLLVSYSAQAMSKSSKNQATKNG